MLNLLVRWDHGQLGWHDPETGQHNVRYEDLEARADTAETRARELEVELKQAELSLQALSRAPGRGIPRPTTPSAPQKRSRRMEKCQQPKESEAEFEARMQSELKEKSL